MKRQKSTAFRRHSRSRLLGLIPRREEESGQTIVLMAVALIGLLVSAGLAVDGGMLMVRKAQLDRAVDAAALTGVVHVDQGLNIAHAEGQRIMAANGIDTFVAVDCPTNGGLAQAAAPNPTPTAMLEGTTYQHNSPSGFITYPAGTWGTVTHTAANGGTTYRSATAGAKARFSFNGTGFTLYRRIDAATWGTMNVCVDGTSSCQLVDNGVGTAGYNQPVSFGPYPSGVHTVEIINQIGGKYLDIDAVEITGPADLPRPDYCGRRENGLIPGSVRYHVEARSVSETYFMSMIGIDDIPIISTATAEYMPLVDLYAGDVGLQGLINTSTQSVYGRNTGAVGRGDPYSPYIPGVNDENNGYYSELYGAYTYRIRIPGDYEQVTGSDLLRVEILDPDTGNPPPNLRNPGPGNLYNNYWGTYSGYYKYLTYSADGYSQWIKSDGTNTGIYSWGVCGYKLSASSNPMAVNETPNAQLARAQTNACALRFTQWRPTSPANPNPYWLVRFDEMREADGDGWQLTSNYNTISRASTATLFRLYYLQQQPDGSLEPVDLAYYIGKPHRPDTSCCAWSPAPYYDNDGDIPYTYTQAAINAEAVATDRTWVAPGAPQEERLPGFDRVNGRNCVFEEVATYDGTGINVPSPADDYCTWPEPQTYVENCPSFLASNGGPREQGGFSNASRCGDPHTDYPGEQPYNFIINLKEETAGIYQDPGSMMRDIYLEVRSLDGASENGYSFWAGPPRSADRNYEVPAEANARQLFINATNLKGHRVHYSEGVAVYAMGYMPMNSIAEAPVDIPLAFLGPEFAGNKIRISMFDPDSGAQDPIGFFFDSIPILDWSMCYDDTTTNPNCTYPLSPNPSSPWRFTQRLGPSQFGSGSNLNAKWATPPYSFNLPSEAVNQPFYGGRLTVSYYAGHNDTYVWKLTIESRPYLVQ